MSVPLTAIPLRHAGTGSQVGAGAPGWETRRVEPGLMSAGKGSRSRDGLSKAITVVAAQRRERRAAEGDSGADGGRARCEERRDTNRCRPANAGTIPRDL